MALSFSRSAQLNRNSAPTPKHETKIVIVAGPSGSGKSTFIDELRCGTLSADLRKVLPEGCEHWPVVGVTRATRRAARVVDAWAQTDRSKGLILHYDISFIYRTGEPTHECRAVKDLFVSGGCPIIVSVRPSPEQLRRQFQERRNGQLAGKSTLHRIWGSKVRQPARRLYQKLKGQPGVDINCLYDDPDWLSDCNARWDAFVESLRQVHPDLISCDVAPSWSEGAARTFRPCSVSQPNLQFAQ